MEVKRRKVCNNISSINQSDQESEISDEEQRRGPWTVEEDLALINYVANQGEGRWNSLARCAGLKRTGKSCRLRWLNYLRPDVRRGNITLQEQLLILDLHSRWGNRWSKIAQHLPGRTDNEIKNYWRTRVQKHAKQLKCDVNSKQFKDTMRYLWMPRLVERIRAAAAAAPTTATSTTDTSLVGPTCSAGTTIVTNHINLNNNLDHFPAAGHSVLPTTVIGNEFGSSTLMSSSYPEISSTAASSTDSFGNHMSPVSEFNHDKYNIPAQNDLEPENLFTAACDLIYYPDQSTTNIPAYFNQGLDFQATEQNSQWLFASGDPSADLWNNDDINLFLQQQLNNDI